MTSESTSLLSKLHKLANSAKSEEQKDGKVVKQKGTQPAKPQEHSGAARCYFCSKPIPADHKHFADLENMKFMCTCELCAVLQAESGTYHQVPERYKYLKGFDLPGRIWLGFRIPVNMAFIVYNSARQKPVAYYPSPAGATESELRLESWDVLTQKNPVLNDMDDDLEGFMINRLDEPHEHFIMPIDCCYKLIGLIRTTWQGLNGGEEMRSSVRTFFDELKRKGD
jgi:hypothetical protein